MRANANTFSRRPWNALIALVSITLILTLPLWGGAQSSSPKTLAQFEVLGYPKTLRKVTHEELFKAYESAHEWNFVSRYRNELGRDDILSELVRRGDAKCEKFLQDQLPLKATARKTAENPFNDDKRWRAALNTASGQLEMLTALRRVQKKRDPLTVEVSFPKGCKSNIRELPTFEVALTNVDEERMPVWIKHGGNYRSGRQARWRFEVHNAKGNPLPPRSWHSFIGGGMYTEGPLAHGESWRTSLPMDQYIRIVEPGEYKVRILYHDGETIADLENVAGLIVSSSKPFKLQVDRLPTKIIQLEAGSRERAKALIAKLAEESVIRVVMGTYDASSYDFLDPKSTAGQLHTMGWQAVPQLLDSLRDDQLSFRHRGNIVILLHALTDDQELCRSSSCFSRWSDELPAFEYRRFRVKGYVSSFREDEKKQRELAKQWLKFQADYLDIREAK